MFVHPLRPYIIAIIAILYATVLFPPVFNSTFNRLEPWVLGMPFLQFWIFFVGFATAILLLVLWYLENTKEGEE